MGRIPNLCPPGFTRYRVRKGDSMYLVARRLKVSTGFIIANNPHISNPLKIYPGDTLCVPEYIELPCCTVLKSPIPSIHTNGLGVALADDLANGEQSVSILAKGLPNPNQFGNYDAYEGYITFPGIGSYHFILYSTPEIQPTWSRTLTIPQPLFYKGAVVQVRTTNSAAPVSPHIVLIGTLCK